MAASDETNKTAPNYFGLYAHEVAKLLSKYGYTDQMVSKFMSAGSLFSNGIGAGLSDFKKDKLKRLLRQSVTILTQEVDEMIDPVLNTRRLLFHLTEKKYLASCSNSENDGDPAKRPYKKLKGSSSCSTGVPAHASPASVEFQREDSGNMNSKFSGATALDKEASHAAKNGCSHCHTLLTPMWRNSPEGAKLCNACGLQLRKKRTKNKEREFLLGSHAGNIEENEEVNGDLKFLLENDRQQVEQMMKKYSGELYATLDHMGQQLNELLDTLAAKCRPMSLFEMQRLRNMIQNLPLENLDRVAEILGHGKSAVMEIFVDLEEEGNATLWRLYYYVEAVVNARKLSRS